jgi:hypothetical protein
MLTTIQIECDTIGELQAHISKIVVDLKKEFDKEGYDLLSEPMKDIHITHENLYGNFDVSIRSEYEEREGENE